MLFNSKTKIQNKVLKHLEKNGFNCMLSPKNIFPTIVAWKPFEDVEGNPMLLKVQSTIDGVPKQKVLMPYFISLIECKKEKKLSQKENNTIKKILEEGRCNSFLVAHEENKELKFQEIEFKTNLPKEIKTKTPSYLG